MLLLEVLYSSLKVSIFFYFLKPGYIFIFFSIKNQTSCERIDSKYSIEFAKKRFDTKFLHFSKPFFYKKYFQLSVVAIRSGTGGQLIANRQEDSEVAAVRQSKILDLQQFNKIFQIFFQQ
jgi:hypothetical protein